MRDLFQKKPMVFKSLASAGLILCLTGLSAVAGGYTNDFSSDPSVGSPAVAFKGSAGWSSTGGADSNGYVRLTDAANGQQGKMVLPDLDAGALEAYSLGFGEAVEISAEHGEGLADLYAAIEAATPASDEDETEAGANRVSQRASARP